MLNSKTLHEPIRPTIEGPACALKHEIYNTVLWRP